MSDVVQLAHGVAVDRDEAMLVIEHSVRFGFPVPLEEVRVAAAAQFVLDQIEADREAGRHDLTQEASARMSEYIVQLQKHTDAMKRRLAVSQAVGATLKSI